MKIRCTENLIDQKNICQTFPIYGIGEFFAISAVLTWDMHVYS